MWEWGQQKLMAAAADIVQAAGKRLAAVHSAVGKRETEAIVPPLRSFLSISYLISTFYSLISNISGSSEYAVN